MGKCDDDDDAGGDDDCDDKGRQPIITMLNYDIGWLTILLLPPCL